MTKSIPRRKPLRRSGIRTESVTDSKKDGVAGASVDLKDDTRQLSESELLVNPAHVTVGGAVTINLGNYSSAKVTVQITRPCADTPEAIEKLYTEESAWVDAKVREEMDKAGIAKG